MYGNLTQSGIFKLFHQIGHAIRRSSDLSLMLEKATEAIGWAFELDRCVVLLRDPLAQELGLAAEFYREPLERIGRRRYQLTISSEWYRLLLEGRPLPMKEIRLEGGEPSAIPELDQFIKDSRSESLVAFPLTSNGQLIGCLSMHHCWESRSFSDELLEVGEAIAEELCLGILQARSLRESELEGRIFRDAMLALMVLDQESLRINQANQSCRELIGYSRQELEGMSVAELFADSDSQRLQEFAASLCADIPSRTLSGLAARTASGEALILDACLSSFLSEDGPSLLLALLPQIGETALRGVDSTPSQRSAKVEELVTTMSKQLNWERLARHIISSLHSTLDRDAVLQTAADSLGRALLARRCLIVKTDGPASPMVTHEYVEPDISPLGLGRTGQFPLTAAACFKQKAMAISDLSGKMRPPELSARDVELLVENGVRSLAGAPIAHHGLNHGMIIVAQSDRPRAWSPQEMEMLEMISDQVAVALNHAQSFIQLKDQLFHMNLIGNLTQQLTNALDLATRSSKPEAQPESASPVGLVPPLSLRELEVLRLIASGLANREIAQRLFLTESTVELHASRIRKKLKLKSRTALVKYACDNNLV